MSNIISGGSDRNLIPASIFIAGEQDMLCIMLIVIAPATQIMVPKIFTLQYTLVMLIFSSLCQQ